MGLQRFYSSSSSLVFLAMATTTTILLLSTTSQAIRPVAKMATITVWCKLTQTPDLCNSILNNTKVATRKQATILAINHTIMELKQAVLKLDVAIVKSNNIDVKNPLIDCKDLYDSAMDDLNIALKKINVPADFLNALAGAESFFVTCSDGFDEFNSTNPMGDVNGRLYQMSSISLALANSAASAWP